MAENEIILVDLDSVGTNYEKAVYDAVKAKHPEIRAIPLEEMTDFSVPRCYPEEHKEKIWAIENSKGFFADMEEIPGFFDSLNEMRDLDHEVYICTSPLSHNPYSHEEKFLWVREHGGTEWAKRLI